MNGLLWVLCSLCSNVCFFQIHRGRSFPFTGGHFFPKFSAGPLRGAFPPFWDGMKPDMCADDAGRKTFPSNIKEVFSWSVLMKKMFASTT
jgi:hypothetical protein